MIKAETYDEFKSIMECLLSEAIVEEGRNNLEKVGTIINQIWNLQNKKMIPLEEHQAKIEEIRKKLCFCMEGKICMNCKRLEEK